MTSFGSMQEPARELHPWMVVGYEHHMQEIPD